LVLIYQGLYKNHSFIIRRSWHWIHINETSIEFGSQSRSWINIKTKTKQKTHKQIKKKQSKTSITKTKQKSLYTLTFRGIVNVEKIYCDFFSCDFFSTDATHTYDIIFNTDIISILIPYSQKKTENNSVYYFRERFSLYSCDVVERRTNLVISTSHGLLNLQATILWEPAGGRGCNL
jgi:hypothetical protein